MFRAGALETVDRRLRRNAASVKLVLSKWEKREVFNITSEILLQALGKAQYFNKTQPKPNLTFDPKTTECGNGNVQILVFHLFNERQNECI